MTTSETRPTGESHVFMTSSQAYYHLVKYVLRRGIRSVPRGLPTIEVPEPVHITIERPADFPLRGVARRFRHAITAGEGLSLVGQTSVPEVITDTVKAFRPFLDGSIFWGAYGPRVAGDLVNLVELIDRDPDTRQAVLTIYDADRDLGRTKMHDIPCTMTIQFRRRRMDEGGGELDMWVAMRSNDVWRGLPYDLGQFTMLQSAVAQSLGIPMGTYHHSMGSLHLYDSDRQEAEDLSSAGMVPPDQIERVIYWGGTDTTDPAVERFGIISSRARRILIGDDVQFPTEFETWLASLVAR